MELICNLAGVIVGLILAMYLVIKGQGSRFGLRKWMTIACLMGIVWWVITVDDDIAGTVAMIENVRTAAGLESKATSQPDLVVILVRFGLNSFSQDDNFPDWLRFPELAHEFAVSQWIPNLDNRPPPSLLPA
jgi:hypothetical protein